MTDTTCIYCGGSAFTVGSCPGRTEKQAHLTAAERIVIQRRETRAAKRLRNPFPSIWRKAKDEHPS